jgi:peptidoglycan/LPS O-acetylase OafA/YrhL
MVIVFLTHAVSGQAARVILGAGWTSVDLFFVISGFLITGILLDTRDAPQRWRNFFARRVLRIFPLYYGVLVVLFVVLPVVWPHQQVTAIQPDQPWYWAYAVNFLAIAKAGEPWSALGTGHFWSLAIEEQFYLVWPIVVWCCTPRTLLRVALGTMIVSFALRCWLVLADPFHTAWSSYVLIPAHTDGLMVGAALALVARRQGGLERAARVAPAVALAALGALVIIALGRRGLLPTDSLVAVLGYPIVALLWGAVLVAALTRPGRLGCEHPWLRTIGKYSYGIYVFHLPIIAALQWRVFAGTSVLAVTLFTVLTAGLSFGFAWLSYHAYEKHFLTLKRFFDGAREHAPPPRAARPVLTRAARHATR